MILANALNEHSEKQVAILEKQAAILRATIECMAMQTANNQHERNQPYSRTLPYSKQHFDDLVLKHGISYDAICKALG